MLTLALALAFQLAPTGLASAPFAQLPTQGAAAGISWRWPTPADFIQTLEAPAQPLRVVGGRVFSLARKGLGARFDRALAKGEAEAFLAGLMAREKDPSNHVPFGVVTWSPTRGEAVLDNLDWGAGLAEGVPTEHRLGARTVLVWRDFLTVVEGELSHDPKDLSADARTAWAYSTTLLLSEPPVYDTEVSHDWALQAEIAAHLEAGRTQAALDLYRRFQPMGRCSMDTAPASTARAYADLCYQVGRMGCFLQLQVRIMGDRFQRVAWSSYGERAADTQSSALTDAGVDTRRFLLGLLLDYDTPLRAREGMNLWRLARSRKESGLDFSSDLMALATDSSLDAANRHRAVVTLWLLKRRAEEQPVEAFAAVVKGQDLPAVSRGWLVAAEAKNTPEGAETIRLFE